MMVMYMKKIIGLYLITSLFNPSVIQAELKNSVEVIPWDFMPEETWPGENWPIDNLPEENEEIAEQPKHEHNVNININTNQKPYRHRSWLRHRFSPKNHHPRKHSKHKVHKVHHHTKKPTSKHRAVTRNSASTRSLNHSAFRH